MLLSCEGEVYEGADDVSRIKGDEGELDALTTYLEAVQVFLHQHMHSRNDALLQHQLSPTCATVSFTPLGQAEATQSSQPAMVAMLHHPQRKPEQRSRTTAQNQLKRVTIQNVR